MESKIRMLVDSIHSLNRGHESITMSRGTTNQERIMLDLYAEASKLMQAMHQGNILEQLKEVEAKALIAQATNTIGTNDLEKILEAIEDIKTKQSDQ